MNTDGQLSFLDRVIRFCLENRLLVFLTTLILVVWGLIVAPFDWKIGFLERHPVAVDAIPDIGENQQIVFTEWPGRSPQDIEDQVTYPLTTVLLGIPKVKSVRSYSYLGFSSIYVVFEENADWDWSRTKILEKLSSLPSGSLPAGARPGLGPDATALGQVFWYTLEGRDQHGKPAGGWDPQELRTIQDFYVRYALQSLQGVAEVASVGGFVKEYQVNVDPDSMRAYGITIDKVFEAVRASNIDVGARTIEINRAEYVIRGLGFIKALDDLRQTVVAVNGNVPITLAQIADVQLGPALRRGALDKEGVEAVGGVVVVRHGANPLEVIQRVKKQAEEISAGLPSRSLEDGRISKVTIIPFYDRTNLIHETLDTLKTALTDEVLVTCIVVILIVANLRSSLVISLTLPLAVLLTFIAMKLFRVDANIVALSGIAIAIGTIVDMGIVVTENVLRHFREAGQGREKAEASAFEIVFRATREVGGAVLTAVLTTVLSFLPVFALMGREGKLFRPLAFTKTFALIAAILVALLLLPALLTALFRRRPALSLKIPLRTRLGNWFAALILAVVLSNHWQPFGPERAAANLLFVVAIIGGLLILFVGFIRVYPRLLGSCLSHRKSFTAVTCSVVLLGLLAWLGSEGVFGFLPRIMKGGPVWAAASKAFPGLGKEFMPPLDEGSFLFMPTTMPHASIGEAMDVLQKQDLAIRAIPEVKSVVGKIGRAESPLDPAPVSMVETVVLYKDEYRRDERNRIARFKYDRRRGRFERTEDGELIPDRRGRPFRQWRDHIRSPDDIWNEIVEAARIPGTTSAPKLQPIEARLTMLQSGMRAAMGLKVFGPDLETIERVGLDIERLLKQVPAIREATVFADRTVGKPYLEIDINRPAIARYGMTIRRVQDAIEVAVGGKRVTTTVEGRERYPVRVRYLRELRDTVEALGGILVPAADGAQIPLRQLADIRYVRGPQVIKSEETFPVGYVIFDGAEGHAEVDVVEEAKKFLENKRERGELVLPAGVTYKFTGSYENQVRAEARFRLLVPLALVLIFLIIYLQFRSVTTAGLVFSGIFVAWSGGFILLWLYGQAWFLNFPWIGEGLRDLLQIRPINLSVAVWVGFLALFGIATDNGVVVATYLRQRFRTNKPSTRETVRQTTIEAAERRIRPTMMTTATTVLALLPVLTSTGRGSDVMVPMAIPTFGGMLLAVLTVFVVPVFYCWIEEARLTRRPCRSER